MPGGEQGALGYWLSGQSLSGQHPGSSTPEANLPEDPGAAGPDLGGNRLEDAIDAEIGHRSTRAGRPHPEELLGEDPPLRSLGPVVHPALVGPPE